MLGNDLSPPVLFFVPLIYISPSLFLISYFCFILANLLNLLQLLVIHQSKVHINLTIYLVFHHRYSLLESVCVLRMSVVLLCNSHFSEGFFFIGLALLLLFFYFSYLLLSQSYTHSKGFEIATSQFT